MSAVLKFPTPANMPEKPQLSDETEHDGGDEGGGETRRLVCSQEDCFSRQFWVDFRFDEYTGNPVDVHYVCSNCGTAHGLPDGPVAATQPPEVN